VKLEVAKDSRQYLQDFKPELIYEEKLLEKLILKKERKHGPAFTVISQGTLISLEKKMKEGSGRSSLLKSICECSYHRVLYQFYGNIFDRNGRRYSNIITGSTLIVSINSIELEELWREDIFKKYRFYADDLVLLTCTGTLFKYNSTPEHFVEWLRKLGFDTNTVVIPLNETVDVSWVLQFLISVSKSLCEGCR